MREKEVILTDEGLRKLEDELETLKSVRRREVAERIKQAIEFGDITENSEYEDAKNEQAFLEGQILKLEKMLRNARVIDATEVGTDEVSIGSTIKLKDLSDGEEYEYTIVGSAEADPGSMKISNESPVGQSVLGRQKGAVVDVQAPAGTRKLMILDIIKK
ncbi:MAG: transcription elongation factor GreA [Bacillota bacterium]